MYYKLYKDVTGQWRWNYKSKNGNVIADSGESYHNKSDAERGIEIMKNSSDDPTIE